MRRVCIFFTMLCVVLILAACASVDGRRTTNNEGRTTNVLVTATPTGTGAIPLRPTDTATIPLRPTDTATIPLRPTFTPTPTLTPTPTRTPSPAEVRAARLPALGGWAWRADGDSVKLYDANNQAVAVFDTKSGALRWDSKEHFKALEPYLIKDDLKQQLAEKLTEWKQQGIRFITFPDSEGRKEIPPYIVIPTADGKSVQMIPARKGTADFVYNADAKKVMGVFPDGSGYYYLNPDGSFDLAPLQQQAEKIADDLLSRGVIQHPDPAKAKFIRDATASAIMINPYGATPKEINDFIKSRTGKDFAEHFNRTWGDKLGLDYYELMNLVLAQSPQDLFALVKYIGNVKDPRCKLTCWAIDTDWRGTIQIVESDIDSNKTNDPLSFIILKELYGNTTGIKGIKTLTNMSEYRADPAILTRIGESLSLAIKAYTQQLHHRPDGEINISIEYAFNPQVLY